MDLEVIVLNYFPEGFELVSHEGRGLYGSWIFERGEEDVHLMGLTDVATVSWDTERAEIDDSCRINGKEALISRTETINQVLWTCQGERFLLSTSLPWEEAVRIAENLEISP